MIKKATTVSLLATSFLLALTLAPNEAAAKPNAKGAYGKPWRLHFESEFFGLSHFNGDGGVMGEDDDKSLSVGFGIGRVAYIDGGYGAAPFAAYVSRPVLSFGVGYAFSKERAIVGAKVALTVDGFDVGEDSRSTLVGGRFIPYFQWMFLPGSWVRPYVEARVGFGGAARKVDPDPEVDVRATTHVIYPQVGFGGGVHLFPVDYFSVDLGLNFDYLAPHTRTSYEGDPAPDNTEWDKFGDVINFGVLLGASVWFG